MRNDLRTVNAVVGAQRRLREAVEAHTLVLVLPSAQDGCREILLVVAGRLWAQLRANRDDAGELAERLDRCWQRVPSAGPSPIDHDQVDEANILNRWLYGNAGHPAILPLPRPPEVPEWQEVATGGLALTDDDLLRDVVSVETEETAEETAQESESGGQ